MCTELEQVAASDDFKNLTLVELIDYVKREDLVLKNRDPVLIACIEWVNYEAGNRRGNMLDVLKHVQLEQCSSSALDTVCKKYKDLLTEPNVMHMIHDVVLPRLANAEKENVTDEATKEQNNIVVLGGQHNKTCWRLTHANPLSHKWDKITDIPIDQQEDSPSTIVCLPDGFAVMCGGEDYDENSRYKAALRTWEYLPHSPQRLHDTTALYCKGFIYLLGGGGSKDSVYHLNLDTSTWGREQNMLTKQDWPIAASMDGKIFAVHNDANNFTKRQPNPLHMFNGNSWEYKSPVPENAPMTSSACLLNVEKSLYLVGGASKICARYTATTDTWTLLTQPVINHYRGSAFVYGNKIYLCGGGDYGHVTDDIEEYSLTEDKWTTLSLKLPQAMWCFTAAMVSSV